MKRQKSISTFAEEKEQEKPFKLEFPLEEPPNLISLLFLAPFLPLYILVQLLSLLSQVSLPPVSVQPKRRMAVYEIIRTPDGWRILEMETER